MREKQLEESRKLILDGFFSILKETEYTKITMSEIAKASMVTRMTLYRHFKSKDEILKSFIMNLVDLIKERYHKEETQSFSSLISIRNQEIYKNKYLKIALSNNEAEPILRGFIIQGRTLFSDIDKYVSNRNKYLYDFIVGGIENITTKWILDGMKESPERITNETLNILRMISLDKEGQ